MLIQTYWFWSLLLIPSTIALVSTSSSHHATSTTIKSSSTLHTSTTKKGTTSTSSAHHTSTSSTKKTTTLATSTHKTSSSTKISTATPTPSSSTFYLTASNTNSTALDGLYFECVPDPQPVSGPDGPAPDSVVMRLGTKTSKGASTFTLNADGTFQCNSNSGPKIAGVSNGHPYTQKMIMLDPSGPYELNTYGYVSVTCAISGTVFTCQWYNLVLFFYEPSDVVNGTDIGGYVDLGDPSDGTGFNMSVVYT